MSESVARKLLWIVRTVDAMPVPSLPPLPHATVLAEPRRRPTKEAGVQSWLDHRLSPDAQAQLGDLLDRLSVQR